jgi:hypothetical protein
LGLAGLEADPQLSRYLRNDGGGPNPFPTLLLRSKEKCVRVYPKNVHQPWPLALKYSRGEHARYRILRVCTGAGTGMPVLDLSSRGARV